MGGGKDLVAGPLKKGRYFFAASLSYYNYIFTHKVGLFVHIQLDIAKVGI